MKKMALMCLFTAFICGNIFAQSNTQITTIKGTLKLSGERFSVVSGKITYSIRGLERLVGVIDGLKDGAQVSIDGYALPPTTEGQANIVFNPVRLTINGKSYEVGSSGAPYSATGRNGSGGGSTGRGR